MHAKVSRRFLSGIFLFVLAGCAAPLNGQQSMCAPVSNNPLVMENLCSEAPSPMAMPAVGKVNTRRPTQNLLTLTAEEVNRMKLSDPPMVRMGDALVFEANRDDFVLEIFLSNGKEIVSRPQALARNEIRAGWKKGWARLDYPESLKQYIVGMRVRALHLSGEPLLLRGVKIDRQGSYILELKKTHPGPGQSIPDPPMSYPPDPHVMTASVAAPSLLGREPQTGFLAPRLPAFSIHPMMFQSTGTADPNHYKYIGRELDEESGLYYMGARHYSPGLGRFVQPDPLYIEMHRLIDPQQLNLYAYSQNNPTTFSDPTGLDIKLNCQGGQKDCNTALGQFNGREKAGFKAGLDKNNKLTAHLSKTEYNKLSAGEKALYNAINNTSNHATLNVVGNTEQSEFGVHNSNGVNTVDLENTAKLDAPSNAGGLNSGDVIAHEVLDSYFSLTMGDVAADRAAAALFPGLFQPTENKNDFNATRSQVSGATQYQGISDGRGGERVSFQYITSIPAIDVDPRFNSQGRINDTTHDARSRVTGVTFEPKKQ